MNVVAHPLTLSPRFNAILIEGQPTMLADTMARAGCGVRRATARTLPPSFVGVDVLVIAGGVPDVELLELVSRAVPTTSVLVVAHGPDQAVRAARRGAATVLAGPLDLVGAQLRQMLEVVELRRKVARTQSVPRAADSDSVVVRRPRPLPKEATLDALGAVVNAAESLVTMHELQQAYVDYALRRFGGNKVHTASALGIDRRTIQRWERARDTSPASAEQPRGVERDACTG
ncbi:MAG: hypothetical protein KC657_03070 [Myxococcales bacterium]|nr:hypothetical protein [Myxococcales bacterium]